MGKKLNEVEMLIRVKGLTVDVLISKVARNP